MVHSLKLRRERPGDEHVIHDVTTAAFEGKSYSSGTEADIVSRLRADGDLLLSFVACDDALIVGHIAFSPVSIGRCQGWCALGPVSVVPDHQRQGIGSELVRTGLLELKANGVRGCGLIGDPAFYGRFGFVGDGKISYANMPANMVQWLSLVGDQPSGELRFSPAFDQT